MVRNFAFQNYTIIQNFKSIFLKLYSNNWITFLTHEFGQKHNRTIKPVILKERLNSLNGIWHRNYKKIKLILVSVSWVTDMDLCSYIDIYIAPSKNLSLPGYMMNNLNSGFGSPLYYNWLIQWTTIFYCISLTSSNN